LAESWQKLKKGFELLLTATEKDDKVKMAILLRVIGPRGVDIYEDLKFDAEGDDTKYEMVINKFDGYSKPRNFLFIERYRRLNMKQDELSVEQFETKLRTQARFCKLKDLKDELSCHAFLKGLFMKACSAALGF